MGKCRSFEDTWAVRRDEPLPGSAGGEVAPGNSPAVRGMRIPGADSSAYGDEYGRRARPGHLGGQTTIVSETALTLLETAFVTSTSCVPPSRRASYAVPCSGLSTSLPRNGCRGKVGHASGRGISRPAEDPLRGRPRLGPRMGVFEPRSPLCGEPSCHQRGSEPPSANGSLDSVLNWSRGSRSTCLRARNRWTP